MHELNLIVRGHVLLYLVRFLGGKMCRGLFTLTKSSLATLYLSLSARVRKERKKGQKNSSSVQFLQLKKTQK